MTIDEAIEKYKEITNPDTICLAHCDMFCDKCVQESEQLIEWLEELKVYQQHKIICNKGYNAGYNKAIDDFVKMAYDELLYNENLTEIDIDYIAEQLKASASNENKNK